MERDRSAERIDQSHAEQIQRDGHGEGHEGRCCGEREHGEAASESDEEADHADSTLTPAMSQARREKPRREDDQNRRRERQSEFKGGKAQLAHQDGGRRSEEGVKPADDKAHRKGGKEKARIDGQAAIGGCHGRSRQGRPAVRRMRFADASWNNAARAPRQMPQRRGR